MSSPQLTFVFEAPTSPSSPYSRISTPLSVLLERLDAIPSSTIPSGFIRNTKLMNSLYSKKQQQIDVIVSEFAELYTPPINWHTLFEQRMIACGNTLTTTQSEHYKNVLDFYLQFKILNNENRLAAKSLVTHLETHTSDPDNSLIGLTPSKSIIENMRFGSQEDDKGPAESTTPPPRPENSFASNFTTQDLIEMILSWDEMSDDDAAICLHQFAASVRNHNSGALPLSLSSTPTSSLPKTFSSPALLRSSSYNSLSSSAYSASPPASPTRTPSSFSLFPGLFKKSMAMELKVDKVTTPWKEGDVVVVFVGMVSDSNNKEALNAAIKRAIEEVDEECFMFARVSDPCIDADQSVGVYIDKYEQKTRVVSKESVFKHKFEQAAPSMVADLTQKFFGKLTTKLAEKTNLFLVSQGVDLQVLERVLVNDASFFDMPVLYKNIACIHNLQILDSIAWTNFLDTVRNYSESRVKSFVAEIEDGKIFALSRKQVLSQLHNFDYASIPTARLQSYLSSSQTTLDTLKTQQENILDGTAKNQLSEWYLDHIKDCVDSFLVRNGFELDVIPENYIDQAPKDLALVNKNWTMVRELLDIIGNTRKTQDHHEVIDVMTNLMDDIYTRLEEFVRDTLFVVSERMGVTKTYFDVSDNQDIYDECCKLFAGKKDSLGADLSDKIEDLLKDVEYIFKIREMEGFEQEKKSLDHVPISGLIASRFFRLENELRTSLEVWEPKLDGAGDSQGTNCDESQSTNFENSSLKVAVT